MFRHQLSDKCLLDVFSIVRNPITMTLTALLHLARGRIRRHKTWRVDGKKNMHIAGFELHRFQTKKLDILSYYIGDKIMF